MIIWKRCLTARNRTLYRGEIAFPFGGNRVKEIFCWHYHLVADNHFHNGDYVRLRPFLLMEWYLSRMSRTRSFDWYLADFIQETHPVEWIEWGMYDISLLRPMLKARRRPMGASRVNYGAPTIFHQRGSATLPLHSTSSAPGAELQRSYGGGKHFAKSPQSSTPKCLI